MEIQAFEVTEFMVNCYVLKDGGEAIVVDPGAATPGMLRSLEGCAVRAIVNTHGHCDHCGGNAALKEQTGAELVCHEADAPLLRMLPEQGQLFGVSFPPSPEPDRFVQEGDVVAFGEETLRVVHTPGHSPGHIILVGDGLAFVGDVLFAGSVGRTDLMGGNHNRLLDSIRMKVLTLPDDTVVYAGHGPSTTIGAERRGNPYLMGL